MFFGKSYRSYEEFEREEIRSLERLDVGVDDLLGEFDQDEQSTRRAARREGLFDNYDEDDDSSDGYDD